MNLKQNLIFLLLTSFLITSCGDLFHKKKEDSGVTIDQLATCKMDTSAFSKILEYNIRGEILCLQQNLHVFLDVIRTERVGYLNKTKLKIFLEKNSGELEFDGDINGIIDAIYSLSYLMFSGDRENISRKNVDELIDFLIYFNEHIFQIYHYFSNTANTNYARHAQQRQIVYDESILIANKLERIFEQNRQTSDRINMLEFIEDFFGSENEDIVTFEKIKSLLFVKKTFFGGNKTELTYQELHAAIQKLPRAVQIVFDLARTKKLDFSDDQQLMVRLYSRDLEGVKELLHFGSNDYEELMNVYEVVNAVEKLFPDMSISISTYVEEIMELKKPLMGFAGPHITSIELYNLIGHIEGLLKKSDMFYSIYANFKTELNSYGPITRDFREFPVHTREEEKILFDFARIANEYKFFKGSLDSPVFSHEFHRNPNAFVEIAAVEYLVTLIFAEYGRQNPLARGGYDMTMDQVVGLVKKLKFFLKDQGLINIGRVGGGEIQSTADNLVLMSTLFQYQSDGCDTATVCMEVPELTEFAIGLLTALSVKDFFTEQMLKVCGSRVDQFDRIEVECFRENFLKVLEARMPGTGNSLSDYMPMMYKYLTEMTKKLPNGALPTDSSDYMKFITETEAFTRTCTHYDEAKTELVPMKANDAFAVFAGLLNLESTLLRFDTNGDNRLNGDKRNNEVLNAYYEVYQGAIKGLVAPNGGFMEKLAKPIFQYLIKYGEVPDTKKFNSIWSFVKFLLRVNKRADATRTTIATVLKTLGDQSENSKLHPYKCEECLRDPNRECLPEGNEWN